MNELIVVSSSDFNGTLKQTVNARDLHAFLGVATPFNDWIARRLDEYEFKEDEDYIFATQKRVAKIGRGGQNKKDYHITLSMAKELSMVERTSKGREARKYFIECEEKLLKLNRPKRERIKIIDHDKVEEATRHEMDMRAVTMLPPVLEAVRSLNLFDNNECILAANRSIQRKTTVNLLQWFEIQLPASEITQSHWYNPTSLGKQIGVDGRQFNIILARNGMQRRVDGEWNATTKGKQYSKVFDIAKGGGPIGSVTQLKWQLGVLDVIKY